MFGPGDHAIALPGAAAILRDHAPGAHDIRRAAQAARAAIVPCSDHHASAEYRGELIAALTTRALAQAMQESAP